MGGSHINPAIILKLKLPHIESLALNFADYPSKKIPFLILKWYPICLNQKPPEANNSSG
jgi:hypothetical protein